MVPVTTAMEKKPPSMLQTGQRTRGVAMTVGAATLAAVAAQHMQPSAPAFAATTGHGRFVASNPKVAGVGADCFGGALPGAGAGHAPLVGVLAASVVVMVPVHKRHARGRHPWGKTSAIAIRAAAADTETPPPELLSDCGVDYTKLQELLDARDFKAADAETRQLLIKLAGKAAEKRGWVYFAEVRTISEVDLGTVDGLWKHYSKGKFGFAVQRKIWRQCREQFDKFAEKVSWFTDTWTNRNWPDEFIYQLDAPAGHLPLTNCIRGAQVLQELLSHPAFDKKRATDEKTSSRATAAALASMGTSSTCSLSPNARNAGGFCGGTPKAAFAVRARRYGASCKAAAATAEAPTQAAEATGIKEDMTLAKLPEHNVINEHGFVFPDVPESSKASAFVIYDAQRKQQYLGFSKDLRNTLRTLLCRRPELCYHYKCVHFDAADNAPLLQVRAAWVSELGALPPGNKEPRQKALWESPVDAGAMSERAYKTVAEQKAKQILRQLKDRDLKETIEFKEDLILQGKVDPLPSTLSASVIAEVQAVVAGSTRHCEYEIAGKSISFDIFYLSEFDTKGGWWFDVEVSANKTKSTHRVIVGRDFAAEMGQEPRPIAEAAFAVLLARGVARKTEGLITSEVFPVNYFTATNVAVQFPEYLEVLGRRPDEFDWDRAQWNFKQVHDYAQDDKRTIPAGPMGGLFDPLALQ